MRTLLLPWAVIALHNMNNKLTTLKPQMDQVKFRNTDKNKTLEVINKKMKNKKCKARNSMMNKKMINKDNK